MSADGSNSCHRRPSHRREVARTARRQHPALSMREGLEHRVHLPERFVSHPLDLANRMRRRNPLPRRRQRQQSNLGILFSSHPQIRSHTRDPLSIPQRSYFSSVLEEHVSHAELKARLDSVFTKDHRASVVRRGDIAGVKNPAAEQDA